MIETDIECVTLQTTKAPQASMIFLRGFPGRRPVRTALVIPLGRYLTFHSIVRSSRLKGNGLDLLPCFARDIKKYSRLGVFLGVVINYQLR